MSHLLHYLPTSLADNELTHYKLVKYQHDYIFHLFKLLKDKIKTHILTEESLMDYRNEKKTYKKHNDLLEKLDSIKEEFETHIKLYGNFNIHRL